MSAAAFEPAVRFVLAREGGFVQDPRDPGGATKFGITRRTLARARGGGVSVEDVRALSEGEARAIYRRLYWSPLRADALPPGPDLALFDFAVNSGPARAVRTLQGLLGVPPSGTVDPQTLAAAGAANAPALVGALSRARLCFLQGLPTWPVFGRGWRKRVLAAQTEALRLALPSPGPEKGPVS